MAAIYYTYRGNDVFMANVPVAPVQLDAFENLEAEAYMTIFTELSISTNETNQIFLTFDDLITYFHFGKGVGNITLSGMIFADCSGNMPGIQALYRTISQIRGKRVTMSLGSEFFTGVIQSSNAVVTAEPTTIVQFSINFAMIDSSLSN